MGKESQGTFVSSTGEAEAGKGQSGLEGEPQVSQGNNQPNKTKQQNQVMDAYSSTGWGGEGRGWRKVWQGQAALWGCWPVSLA